MKRFVGTVCATALCLSLIAFPWRNQTSATAQIASDELAGRIAFLYQQDPTACFTECHGPLWTMEPDGSDKQPVLNINGNEIRNVAQPQFSPDGSQIAFVRLTTSETTDLFVMNTDGTGLINLTNTPGKFEVEPQWSPDGAHLAWGGYLRESRSFFGDGIWMIELPDGVPQQIAAPGRNNPTWSPDGRSLAMERWGETEEESGPRAIVTMPVEGGAETTIVSHVDDVGPEFPVDPEWSPVGGSIAFIATRDVDGTSVRDIYTVSDAGGAPSRVSEFQWPVVLTWSPDGTAIAYQRNRPSAEDPNKPESLYWGIYKIDPVGAAPVNISDAFSAPSNETSPTWIADPDVCGLPEPIPAFELNRKESSEVERDRRDDVPLRRWIRQIKKAIAEVKEDNEKHPEDVEANRPVLRHLKRLLDDAQALLDARGGSRHYAASSRQDGPTGADKRGAVDEAACWALSQAWQVIKDLGLLPEEDAALGDKFLTLAALLDGEEISSEDKKIYLRREIEDLVSRLAKDDLDDDASEANKQTYVSAIEGIFNLLEGYLEGDLTTAAQETLEEGLTDAAEAFGGKESRELVSLMFTLRKVIAGEASSDEQWRILKESVANLADRLTTILFGKALLSTPQARAFMFGFELGTAFGERIAADLELIFRSALVNQCIEAFVDDQGANGPGDVVFWEESAVVVTDEASWHPGWRCHILPEAYVEGIGGGVVLVTPPTEIPFYGHIMWRVTIGGDWKNGKYWDPACRFRGPCRF